MKHFFLILVVILSLLMIAIFSPIPKMIDRLLISEKEVALWEKYAIEGNMTATSNLIWFYDDKTKKDQWFDLYIKQRKQREDYYMVLKKKAKEGNITAKEEIQKIENTVGYLFNLEIKKLRKLGTK